MNVELNGTEIFIGDAYKQRAAVSALEGARWSPMTKCWIVDASAANVASLSAMTSLPPKLEAMLPTPDRVHFEDREEWLSAATPYAHQREAVAAAIQTFDSGRPGFALLMEMGCGKTLAAIEIALRLARRGKVSRILVVCPSAVVPVWSKEIAAYVPASYGVEVRELLGSRPKRLKALHELAWCGDNGARILVAVINYESAWRIADELIAWGADLVIADESQRIKGHASKQTKGVTAIGSRATNRLALSGTPVTNGPLDVFAQWRYLDANIFGKSYFAFRTRYAIMGGFEGKQVVGYRALDELTRKAHAIAYRVTKAQALDLPETTDVFVPVDLSPAERRAYDELARESVVAFESGETSVSNVLVRLLRLQQIAGGNVPKDDGSVEVLGSSKADTVFELADEAYSGGDSVVVFCRFRAEIAALAERLGGAARVLTGDTPQAERGALIEDFQAKRFPVLIAQTQVGGAGLTLHAASTMIFSSLSFSYGDYEQAKARIHRIGQARPCTYYHVVARGTVDELVVEALRNKGNVADLIVNRGAGVFDPPKAAPDEPVIDPDGVDIYGEIPF
jgi:SNF2 family DNA or RNA helicase